MSFRITRVRSFHEAAFRHNVSASDIVHALEHPMRVIDQGDGRRLYLGSGRSGELLEVVAVSQADKSQLVIHAMPMRTGYATLLPGE